MIWSITQCILRNPCFRLTLHTLHRNQHSFTAGYWGQPNKAFGQDCEWKTHLFYAAGLWQICERARFVRLQFVSPYNIAAATYHDLKETALSKPIHYICVAQVKHNNIARKIDR